MVRLFAEFAVFILPILLALCAIEALLSKTITSHSIKHRLLDRSRSEVTTLILGSSAAYWGISPRHLTGIAFNLANVSQTPYYDERLVSKLQPGLPGLKRVIVTVNYVTLFYQLHDGDEKWRQYYFNQEWGIPPPLWMDRLDFQMWSRIALQTPQFAAISVRRALSAWWRGERFTPELAEATDIDEWGWWRPAGQQWNESPLSPSMAAKAIGRHHRMMHLSHEQANLASLEHLMASLGSKGIEVVLVTLPVWPTYSAEMKPEYWDRTIGHMKDLSARYRVRYLEMTNLPELEAEDFIDSSHLSIRGAVRFTSLLNEAVVATSPP